MQEKIIGAIGILLALVCSVAGWWMENGPDRPKKDDRQDSDANSREK